MPGPVVVQEALMMCAAGTAPMPLTVLTNETVRIDGLAIATIMDCVPMANIPPFGTCNILTAAALGVPTPCVPAPVGPWTPGSEVQFINGLPVLTMPAMCQCGIGGVITITEPGQVVEVSM